MEQFNKIITINSPEDKKVTLNDCLINFSLHEKLEKENEWFCPRCNKLTNAYKKMDLFYIPKYFIISFKRFRKQIIDAKRIQLLKNTELVEFPTEKLNFEKYVLGPKIPKPLYELYAVCQHSGSIEGGHYISACKNFGKWYMFDDTAVFPCDEDLICSPEGYILFFKKSKEKVKGDLAVINNNK